MSGRGTPPAHASSVTRVRRRLAALAVLATVLSSCAGSTERATLEIISPRVATDANDRSPGGQWTPNSPPKPPRLWRVVRVVDGDTVEVAHRGRTESVRVIGIDTPETVHPTEPVECWGPQASADAERLLRGRRVLLRFDPSQGRRDTYDRLLAYVVIPGRGDFGELMLKRGNAAEYTYDDAYARRAAYRAAEAEARVNNRGLWRECGGVDVPLWRARRALS